MTQSPTVCQPFSVACTMRLARLGLCAVASPKVKGMPISGFSTSSSARNAASTDSFVISPSMLRSTSTRISALT